MLANQCQFVLLLWILVSRSLCFVLERDNHQDSSLIANRSTSWRSPSEDCNTCIIEAPGGVSLVYWAPADANLSSAGNETNDSQPVGPYTQVENGFTL